MQGSMDGTVFALQRNSQTKEEEEMFGAISGFIRGTKRVPIIEDPNDENFWEKVDINTMTRLELRIALDSRGKGGERRRRNNVS